MPKSEYRSDAFHHSGQQPRFILTLIEKWILLAIVLTTICIYLTSLQGPFFFDDIPAIVNNQAIKGAINLDNLLDLESETPLSGRPLVALSFALNFKAFGTDPFGYKLTNVIIHILNTLFVFKILGEIALRAGSHPNRNAFVVLSTAIWAFHPINSEAIAYTTQRTELMAGMFVLATIALYFKSYASSNRTVYVFLATTSCIAGVLCKESAATIPIVIAVLDRAFFSASWTQILRERKFGYLSLLTSWGVAIPLILAGPRSSTVGWGLGMNSLEYLLNQAVFIPGYFQALIWPKYLLIHYSNPNWDAAATYVWPAIFWAIITLIFMRFGYRSWKAVLPFLLCAILLSPTSSIVPIISELAAERRMYLPSIVVIATLVFFCAKFQKTGILIATTLAVLLAARTQLRSRAYQSPSLLWQQVVDRHPDDIAALSALGDAYYLEGRERQALQQYEKSFENGTGLISSIINTAWIHLKSMDPEIRNAEQAHLLAELAQETVANEKDRVSQNMEIEAVTLLAETSIATKRWDRALQAIEFGRDIAQAAKRSDALKRFNELKARTASESGS